MGEEGLDQGVITGMVIERQIEKPSSFFFFLVFIPFVATAPGWE